MTGKDGNCLFHAIIDQEQLKIKYRDFLLENNNNNNKNKVITWKEFRKLESEELRTKCEKLLEAFPDLNQFRLIELRNNNNPNEWGDAVTLKLLAELLQCQIYVVESNTNWISSLTEPITVQSKTIAAGKPVLTIGHLRESHYYSIVADQ